MPKLKYGLLILVLVLSPMISFAEDTDLEIYERATQEAVARGEALYEDFDKPGTFLVDFVGIDEETQGPTFHIQYIRNEYFDAYTNWSFRYDITSYVDGMLSFGFTTGNVEGTVISEQAKGDDGSFFRTMSFDYNMTFPNSELLPLNSKYSFGLSRYSYQGGVLNVIQVTSFDIQYEPSDLQNNTSGNETDFTVEQQGSNLMGSQPDKKSNFFTYIGLAGAGGLAFYLLKTRKTIKLKKQKPVKSTEKTPIKPKANTESPHLQKQKMTPKDPDPIKEKPLEDNGNKIVNFLKKTGDLAIKGLKTVTKVITVPYENIKKIGVDTPYGRFEVGDIVVKSGTDQVINVVKTINELCDVISGDQDLTKVFKNTAHRLIDSEFNKLIHAVNKGLNVNTKTLNKISNIAKEINVIQNLYKEGVSTNELFDLNERIKSLRQDPTIIDEFKHYVNEKKANLEKGIRVENSNFNKLF